MPHNHFCGKCGVQVSMCADDACRTDPSHGNYGDHWCSEHHPDPRYHVAPTPPVGRPVGPVIVKIERD